MSVVRLHSLLSLEDGGTDRDPRQAHSDGVGTGDLEIGYAMSPEHKVKRERSRDPLKKRTRQQDAETVDDLIPAMVVVPGEAADYRKGRV